MNESELSPNLAVGQKTLVYPAGSRVKVTQQVSQRAGTFSKSIEGTVVGQERQRSGSWFARNKNGKVWLDRLIIKKDDGEVSILNLDEFTHIDVLSGDQPQVGKTPMVAPTTDRFGGIR